MRQTDGKKTSKPARSIQENLLFCWVFEQEDVFREIIEAAWSIKVQDLEVVVQEKVYKTPDGTKGIRMDVWGRGKAVQWDVEMQRKELVDFDARLGFYPTRMQGGAIDAGEEYSELGDTYVLVFCDFDPYGFGDPVYNWLTVLDNHRDYSIDDRRHTMLVNMKAWRQMPEGQIREFAQYAEEDEVTGQLSSKIDNYVQRFRKHPTERMAEEAVMLASSFQFMLHEEREASRAEGEACGRDEMAAVAKALLRAERFEDLRALSELQGRELGDAVSRYAEELGLRG